MLLWFVKSNPFYELIFYNYIRISVSRISQKPRWIPWLMYRLLNEWLTIPPVAPQSMTIISNFWSVDDKTHLTDNTGLLLVHGIYTVNYRIEMKSLQPFTVWATKNQWWHWATHTLAITLSSTRCRHTLLTGTSLPVWSGRCRGLLPVPGSGFDPVSPRRQSRQPQSFQSLSSRRWARGCSRPPSSRATVSSCLRFWPTASWCGGEPASRRSTPGTFCPTSKSHTETNSRNMSHTETNSTAWDTQKWNLINKTVLYLLGPN